MIAGDRLAFALHGSDDALAIAWMVDERDGKLFPLFCVVVTIALRPSSAVGSLCFGAVNIS